MRNSKLTISFFLIIGLFAFTACEEEETPAAMPTTIVDVAAGDANFSDLVTALAKADLVNTLAGSGPFTVFAPTNAAFAAAGIDVNALTGDQLKPILLNHVLGAKVLASAVTTGGVETVGGGDIFLSVGSNGVFIDGGTEVVQTDILASNGVIHVINNVLLPPSQNIVEIAVGNPNFSTLVSLVQKVGLVETLANLENEFTVFAPTNAAFDKLFATVDPATLTDEQITNILLYHVVPGYVFSSDLTNGDVSAANGGKLNIDLTNGVVVKGANSLGSNVTAANLKAQNGVIHVIDTVLLP